MDAENAIKEIRKVCKDIHDLAVERERASNHVEVPVAQQHWRVTASNLYLCSAWLNCVLKNHGF